MMVGMVVTEMRRRGRGAVVSIPAKQGITDPWPCRHLDNGCLCVRCYRQRWRSGEGGGVGSTNEDGAKYSSGGEKFAHFSHVNLSFSFSQLQSRDVGVTMPVLSCRH